MLTTARSSSKPPPSAWRDARDLLWEHRRRLMVGFALLIVSRLSSFALPASSKFLVDEVITRRNSALLGPLAAVIIAATLVQALTALALSRVLGMAAQRVIMGLRRDLQRKVMRLPIAFFDSTKSGALIARIMTDPDALRNLLGTGLILTAGNILTALLALIVLLWLNWRLTAMTLALLSTFGVLIAYSFKIIRPLFRQRAEIGAQVVGRLAEALAGVRVVKAYRAEEHENKVFGAGLERLFASVAREVTASAGLGAFATAVLGGISATLVFFGGREVLAGSMTLGDFVMFVFFIGLLLAPVVRIAEAATQLSEAMAGLDRIREVSQMETEEKDDRERESLPAIRGAIEFQDVTFEYTAGIPVLKGISFRAAPDSTTALVGPSGAGKSTVIGLVMGFYRPTGGRILVDGHDLSAVRTRDFRAHLGVVLQENFLFDGTIAENIGYAKPSASREQIVAAAQAAHCDHFVELLENGYETMVGERGVKLSGGQRQRVAIARAILANPRLLILDEATSSLDSESEALVQDGLRSLRQGRTTFVIAHRLSTIHSADQILVLEAGEIVERGNHQSLMAQQGRYRQLHERQFYIEAGSPTLSEIDRFGTPETLLPPAAPSEGPLPVLETLLHRRRGPGSV